MKRFFTIAILALITASILTSCANEQAYLNLYNNVFSSDVVLTRDPQNRYYDLRRGIEVQVVTTQPSSTNTKQMYHLSDKNCFTGPTLQYVRSMGLSEMSPNSDYKLYIIINKVDMVNTRNAEASINVSLKDDKGKEIFTQNGISKSITFDTNIFKASRRTGVKYIENMVVDEVYTQVLEQINWNRIASFLKAEKPTKDEANQIVKGNGDTDLEQTIIRWDIQSRPQGADIFWRVVSKTPEVKSTNNKYLQTTPYEATKALDIKGLTYENSSKVRIILRCEKDGYLSQEKEYDVRMIMDQEEISAFFRLVKEE